MARRSDKLIVWPQQRSSTICNLVVTAISRSRGWASSGSANQKDDTLPKEDAAFLSD